MVLHYAYFNSLIIHHQDIETVFSLYKILLFSIFEMSSNTVMFDNLTLSLYDHKFYLQNC